MKGGYVTGFEDAFSSLLEDSPFNIDPSALLERGRLDQWLLYAGAHAMREAGLKGSPRTGAVLGNLSFPSSEMTEYAETVWLRNNARQVPLDDTPLERQHRFMSGSPVQLLRDALGLGPCAFALDAACASALYAIKLAADRLQDGSADVMLAGAVNRADDLFVYMGFYAL
jgi:3-oxoacyl-(acyl-carrier-protein) synthase